MGHRCRPTSSARRWRTGQPNERSFTLWVAVKTLAAADQLERAQDLCRAGLAHSRKYGSVRACAAACSFFAAAASVVDALVERNQTAEAEAILSRAARAAAVTNGSLEEGLDGFLVRASARGSRRPERTIASWRV